MERWIKGISLLKRWDALVFEVAALIRSGVLVPVRETDGTRRTKESDPCLCCDVPDTESGSRGLGCYSSVECEHGYANGPYSSPKCGGGFQPHVKAQRIQDARFRLSEVEAYEQAHGLGPLPHKPESAEALAETLRAAGITDAGMVARMVKAAFPETNLVELGLLVAGEEKAKDMTPAAATKAAQRALKSK